MRDTGPVSKVIGSNGDSEASIAQVGEARKQLGILQNQMTQGNLDVGARTVNYPDGTVIRASIAGGVRKVNIYVPQPELPVVTLPTIHVTAPRFPEPPLPPVRFIVEVIRGFLSGNNPLIYPFILGNQTINTPAQPGQVLRIARSVEYIFSAAGTAILLPLAVVDSSTSAISPYQPELQIQTGMGVTIPHFGETGFLPDTTSPPLIYRPHDLKSLGLATDPAQLSLFGMNPAWVDTVMTISATMNDGSSAFNEFTLAGGATSLVTIQSEQTLTVTINGTSAAVGTGVPSPTNAVSIAIDVTGITIGFGAQIQVSSLYPGPRVAGGSFQTGEVYVCEWVQTSGNLTSALTSANVAAVIGINAPSSGSYTLTGMLGMNDGYGNVYTLSVDCAVTVP